MEIDITEFFHEACPRDYSASAAEIGQNAGRITWRAACDLTRKAARQAAANRAELFNESRMGRI